ncbi:MAG: DUF72 domain-containing protein [Burkholderiaceae bacterium]
MQKDLFEPERSDQRAKPYIGCAGWGLSSANKHLFPAAGNHLERYSARFSCVEINTSFYRLHRPDTYARWRDSVPEDFRFSVKLLRSITHFKRLQDSQDELQQFLDSVRPLQAKWGCLLVQLPPSLAYVDAHARSFFSLLRELVEADIVCEPRHPSWFSNEVIEFLADLDIAYVEADPPIKGCEAPTGGSLQTRYIRLHGSPLIYHSSYSEEFLVEVAESLNADRASGRRSWCVFDNTASGAAVGNALALLAKVHASGAQGDDLAPSQ